MRTLVKIKEFIVINFQTISSIIRILIQSNFQLRGAIVPGTLPLNTLKILGNGNSINDSDFSTGNDIDYLVVNRHVLSPSYLQIKPKYYVFADDHFYTSNEGYELLNKIKEDTQWDMMIFFPYSKKHAKHLTSLFKDTPQIQVKFYNTVFYQGFKKFGCYLYEKNLAVPRFQNVLAASIYLALLLKYKQIYLYGVEHSWLKNLFVNNKNEVCLDNPHFFDTTKSSPKTWKEIQGQDILLHEALIAYAKMFEAYHELERFAKSRGTKIVNCTKDSFIDAFKRKQEA